MSPVGSPTPTSMVSSVAPTDRASTQIVALPWRQAASIAAVTGGGVGAHPPCSATPWSPAKTRAAGASTRGVAVRCHAPMWTATSSSRASAPLGRRLSSARARTAAAASASGAGQPPQGVVQPTHRSSSVRLVEGQGASGDHEQRMICRRDPSLVDPPEHVAVVAASSLIGTIPRPTSLLMTTATRSRSVTAAIAASLASRIADSSCPWWSMLPAHTVRQSTITTGVSTRASAAARSSCSSIVVHVVGRSARWRAMRCAGRRHQGWSGSSPGMTARHPLATLAISTANALLPERAPPRRTVSIAVSSRCRAWRGCRCDRRA